MTTNDNISDSKACIWQQSREASLSHTVTYQQHTYLIGSISYWTSSGRHWNRCSS